MIKVRKSYRKCDCGCEAIPKATINWEERLPSGAYGWHVVCANPGCRKSTATYAGQDEAKNAWNNGLLFRPDGPRQEMLQLS